MAIIVKKAPMNVTMNKQFVESNIYINHDSSPRQVPALLLFH